MKKYRTGMYGGKFLPFHLGHQYCIEIAASECETLYVILFRGSAEEERILRQQPEAWLSAEERTKRLYKLCEAAGKTAVVVPALIDISSLRLPDGSEDWDGETPLVRALLGYPLDAVYSSEESYGAYFSRAYPEAEHRLVDVKRVHFPISGTQLRETADLCERERWLV